MELPSITEVAESHKAADAACGRDWLCSCAACREVRDGTTKRNTITPQAVRKAMYTALRKLRSQMIVSSGYEFGEELKAMETVPLRPLVEEAMRSL